MFAGLPGIGVGTLFYVLTALWMPFPEILRLVQGTSSAARWRLILQQLFFAMSIILSIMVAERTLMWMLGQASPGSMSPARWITSSVGAQAPQSIFAAPIFASVLLLGAVLLTVEVMRLINMRRSADQADRVTLSEALRNDALNSTPQ